MGDENPPARTLKFEVQVPDPNLQGLERTVQTLTRIKAAMDGINDSFSASGVQRSAAEIEAALKKAFPAESIKGKGLSDTLRAIQADLKLTERDITRTMAAFEKLANAPLKGGRFTSEKGALASIHQAINAQVTELNALMAAFAKGGGKVAAGIAMTQEVTSVTAKMPDGAVVFLTVPPERILASLGPGDVTLQIGVDKIKAVATGGAPAVAAAGGKGGKGGGAAPAGGNDYVEGGLKEPLGMGSGYTGVTGVRDRLTKDSATKYVTYLTKDLKRVTDQITDEGVESKTIVSPLRGDAIEAFRKKITVGLTGELDALTGSLATAGKGSQSSIARAESFERMATFLSQTVQSEKAAAESMGYTAVLAKADEQAARLRLRAQNELSKATQQEARERAAEQKARESQLLTASQAAAQRNAAARAEQAGAKAIASGQAKGQRAQGAWLNYLAQQEEERRDALRAAQQKILDEASVKAAEDQMAALRAAGFNWRGTRRSGDATAGTEEHVFQRDTGGRREKQTITFGTTGSGANLQRVTADLRQLESALTAARGEAGAAGAAFLQNTAKVTAWTASVMLLYGSIGAAQNAVRSFIDTTYQMARLGVVFNGTASQVSALTGDLMTLAAYEGKSTKEAMDSGIAWARILHTRREITEAVRVSLEAANVAEVDAGAATESLQSIYQSYGRDVHTLSATLAQMNEISNTTNAGVGQLFDGLSKVAEVAAEAKIPLGELNGIMGAMIAQTKQSGASVGNALKTIIGRLSTPETLNALRDTFGVGVTKGGDYAPVLDVLDKVYLAYNKMTDAERRALLGRVAGNTQLTRASALLDTYIRAQSLAVRTQLALNSAENENAVIRETTKAQLAGIVAELEHMVSIQGNRGPGQALNMVLETLKGIVHLLNTPALSALFTGGAALFGVMGVRAGISVLQTQSADGKAGFIGRSLREAREVASSFWALMMQQMGKFKTEWDLIWAGIRGRQANFIGPIQEGEKSPKLGAFSSMNQMWNGIVGMMRALGALIRIPAMLAAGMALFNETMAAAGQTIGKSGEAVDAFEQSASRAASKVEAMRQAVHVLDLAMAALPNTTGEATQRMLSDLENLPDQLRPTAEQIAAITADPRLAGSVLGSNRENSLRQQQMYLAEQKRAEMDAIKAQRDIVAKLERTPMGTRDEKLLAEQRGRLDELKARFLKSAVSDATGENLIDPTTGRTRAELAQDEIKVLHERKDVLKQIMDLTKLDDPVDDLRRRLSLQSAYVDLLKEESAALDRTRTQASLSARDAESRARALREKANEAYANVPELSNASKAAGGLNALVGGVGNVLDMGKEWAGKVGLSEVIFGSGATESLLGKAVSAGRSLFPGGITTGNASDRSAGLDAANAMAAEAAKAEADAKMAGADQFNAKAAAIANEVREATAELNRLKAIPIEDARLQRDMELTRKRAAFSGDRYAVGETDVERAIARQAGLKKESAEASEKLNDQGATQNERLAASVRYFELERQYREGNLDLQKKQTDMAAEELNILRDKNKEWQKGLLMASPQETLKRLAALKITGGGDNPITAGQFLASGDLRQYIVDQPGYGFEEARLRRDKARLSGVGDLPYNDAMDDRNRTLQQSLLSRMFRSRSSTLSGSEGVTQAAVFGQALEKVTVQLLTFGEALETAFQFINAARNGSPALAAASGVPRSKG